MIRRQLTRKVLAALDDLATSAPDRYATCWDQFGAVLKEGIVRDATSRQTLLKLARFSSTAGDDPLRLADYVERMPGGQAHIYYLAGAPVEVPRDSPHLESLTATGREVLLLGDPVEALWEVDPTFADLPFRSASSAATDKDADTANGPAGEPGGAADDSGHHADIERFDALLADGQPLDNPGRFVRAVAARLAGDRAFHPPAAEGA